MTTKLFFISAACSVLAFSSAVSSAQKIYQKGFLSKEEAMKSIEVPEGYELQLVLSDPIIAEPVAIAWDGNGVMYVVEMRTYMQDVDASGENKPTSRISRHEDTNGDGVYDKSSIYIDNMVLPRMILPLDDRLMVGVTHTLDLWNYRDTDGDGVADEKVKIYEGGKRGGNMEHQPSGLVWGLDNWIYVTYENVRYRFTDGRLIKEEMPRGSGQWGLTQDDDGRFYYSRAGGESPAEHFQQHPQYGLIELKGQLERDFKKVYPIAPVPDVQGGPRRVGKNGGLNYFTGVAGQEVFRGNNLPDDLYGDLLIPEPVGRLIRRAKINRTDGKTVLSNATPGSEFIRSKDINFRPLQTVTGPDGCLYIVDMHRGIIQQGSWTRKGSYLRGIIQKWGLDKNIQRGRVYRLVHKDHKPSPRPKLNSLATKDLLSHLNSENGWYRDTAKRLITLREDRETVVPMLEKVVLNTGATTQTRITALWTLEGMSAVKPELIARLLTETDTRILCNTIRVSEPLVKNDDATVFAALGKLATASDPEVVIQLLNTIEYCENPDGLADLRDKLLEGHSSHPTVAANLDFIKNKSNFSNGKKLDERLASALKNGKKIYTQLCTECHGKNGKGTAMPGQVGVTLAPALISDRVNGPGETLIRTLLHGMQGPLDGKTYAAGIMNAQGSNDDQWIADISTYIRNEFGNSAPMITPEMVKSIRTVDSDRKTMWTQKELFDLEPKELKNQKKWKLTASHGERSLGNAIDREASSRYTSGRQMEPGMWLQVELPDVTTIQRIVMDCRNSPTDSPVEFSIGYSMDGKTWETTKPQKGTPSTTTVFSPNTQTRFIRINQTGKSSRFYWSIHELHLFGK